MSIAEEIAQVERRIQYAKEFQKSAVEDLNELHERMREGYEPEKEEYNSAVHCIAEYALRIMKDEELLRNLVDKKRTEEFEAHRRKVEAEIEAERLKWADLNRFLSNPEPLYDSDDDW